MLIGVNFVQLAQPFDRDTWSSLLVGGIVSYSAVCKDIIMIIHTVCVCYTLSDGSLAVRIKTVGPVSTPSYM